MGVQFIITNTKNEGWSYDTTFKGASDGGVFEVEQGLFEKALLSMNNDGLTYKRLNAALKEGEERYKSVFLDCLWDAVKVELDSLRENMRFDRDHNITIVQEKTPEVTE
jgi:hypothetical protein